MTEYSYRATDESGAEKTGTVQALSLQAAREQLQAMKLTPVEITESATHSAPPAMPAEPFPADGPIGEKAEQMQPPNEKAVYFPLYETLRLYAGWLLAWYCLVYAVGSYQFIKELPMHIPYAESLFLSPLVLSFTFGAYLFLLLSGIYKAAGKKRFSGIGLTLVGIAVFLLYRMNVV